MHDALTTTSRVMRYSKAKGTTKLVLMCIAAHQGQDGAWVSITRLAEYANCGYRAAQKAIQTLVEMGELKRAVNQGGDRFQRHDRRPNLYYVTISDSPNGPYATNHSSSRGDADATNHSSSRMRDATNHSSSRGDADATNHSSSRMRDATNHSSSKVVKRLKTTTTTRATTRTHSHRIESWLTELNRLTGRALVPNKRTNAAIAAILEYGDLGTPETVATWLRRRHPLVTSDGMTVTTLESYDPQPPRVVIDVTRAAYCDWPQAFCEDACAFCEAKTTRQVGTA